MTGGHENQAYGAQSAPPGTAHAKYPQQATAGAAATAYPHNHPAPGQWSTGLCDCGDDCANCCVTFWCPCITFGQVAEVVDQGTTSCLLAGFMWAAMYAFTGMPCIVSCFWRGKLRAKYNLPSGSCGDFCLHCWCEPCALCQEYRELKNRGLNPSLGWSLLSQQDYAKTPMGIPMQAPMQR